MADIIIEYSSTGASRSVGELQRLQAQLNSTADGTTKLARSLNTSFKNAQEFSRGIGLTTQRSAQAVQRIQELNRVNASAGQRYQVLNKELGVSRKQFLELDKAVATQAQRLREIEQAQRIATEGYQALALASGAVAGAIGTAFAQGTRTFLAFSGAIKQAGAISGASEEEIEALRDEVTRLGIVTSKSPAEIARVTVSLSRAGFEAEQTTAALEGIVRAAEATGESLETVGDIISKTLRVFSIPAEESQRVADALVATANSTNTTVSSIGESLAFVGAQAATANQPLEDTLIAIGLLGDAGIQGSSAGTQLGAALERLKAASAGATSEFSNLVRGNQKAVEAFRLIQADVRNTDGSMRSLIETLPDIQSGLSELSQQDQDLVFKALFGTQGGRALQSILQATPQRVAEVTAAVREAGGSAETTSAQLLQGLGGALQLLQGSLGGLGNEIGEFNAIFLEPLTRAATSLINVFLGLPDPIQKVLIGITGFTGAVAAAVAVTSTLIALQVKERALLIAQTALQLKNNAARVAGAAATTAQAVATGKLTAAQRGLIAQTARSVGTAALFAAAIGAIALALSRFEDGGADARNAAAELREELDRLSVISEDTEEAVEGVLDDIPPAPTDFLDGIFTKLDELENRGDLVSRSAANLVNSTIVGTVGSLNAAVNFLRTGEFDFVTNAEKQVNDLSIGVGLLGDETGAVIDRALELRQTFPGAAEASEEEFRQAIETQRALSSSLEQNRNLLQSLDREQLGSEAYEQLSAQIGGSITLIEQQQAAIRTQTGIAEDGTVATEAQADATENLTQATANLDDILGKVSQRNAEFARSTAEATAELDELFAEGLVSQEDFNRQSLEIEKQGLQDRLNENRRAIAELNQLIADNAFQGEDLAQAQAELVGLETETFELRSELAQRTTDARIAEEERALEELQNIVRETQQEIALSETERLSDIQRQLNEGVISQREADRQRLDSTRERLEAELEAEQSQLGRLQSAAAGGDETAQNAVRESIQRTAELQLALLENEADARQAIADAEIQSIQDRAAEERRSSDQVIAGIEAESRALELREATLERQDRLLNARIGLQRALLNLTEVEGQLEIDRLNEALRLNEQLQNTTDGAARSAIQARLSELGVSQDIASIQTAIAEAEEQQARSRLEALEREQQFERESLEAQARSNELAAQRLVTEARIAQLRSEADVVQAQADLQAAQQVVDPQERAAEVAAAEAQLEAAQQIAALSGQEAQEAQSQLEATREINDIEQEILNAQQEAALAQQEANVEAAEFASNLERAAENSRRIASNLSGVGGSGAGTIGIQGLRTGGPMKAGQPYLVGDGPGGRITPYSEIVVPGTNSRVLANREARRVFGSTNQFNSSMANAIARSSVPTGSNPVLKQLQRIEKRLADMPSGTQIGTVQMPQTFQVARDDRAIAKAIADWERTIVRGLRR